MLFNTFEFFFFFVIIGSCYFLLKHKWQNRLLLAASYFFYGCWDWRFLSLILISTIIDYTLALKIHHSDIPKNRKFFAATSIVVNLGILGFFKYYNFFTESFYTLLNKVGIEYSPVTLNIILPMGISFYTFQTLSYTLDVYKGRIKPVHNFFDLALYVSFFPQLVAGPIERASRLMPQILNPRTCTLEKFNTGCYLIFWGFFQKVFIADNLALIVDPIFANSQSSSPAEILLAIYAFAFQIFCDFAGYSNIARGLGRVLGFDIILNFNLPYFATNPRDFWRRWHISLSTWLRDYLYIPLGGNKKGVARTYVNIMITMLLGGLWHGANWTFVVWGIYQGLLLIIHRLIEPFIPKPKHPISRSIWKIFRIIIFFQFVCLGWLIFRAQSITQVGQMLLQLSTSFSIELNSTNFKLFVLFVTPLLIIQLFQYFSKDLMIVLKWPWMFRAAFYFLCYVLIITYGVEGGQEFIYFQF